MNTMTSALKDVGLAIPLNRRVWQWLKDNPDHTVNEVAAGLEATRADCSSNMSDMAFRGMLLRYKDVNDLKRKNLYRYKTNPKMGAFEMLPLPADHQPHKRTPVNVADIVPVAAPAQPTSRSILDLLSAREAFGCYQELRKMFSGAGSHA